MQRKVLRNLAVSVSGETIFDMFSIPVNELFNMLIPSKTRRQVALIS